MNFNDLLSEAADPTTTLIMRHCPHERDLRKVFPWLAAEKPDVFNAYQQTQSETVEQKMLRARHVASFIGHEPGKALFVGLYAIGHNRRISRKQYWQTPAYAEMKTYGMVGLPLDRPSCLWFEMTLRPFHSEWKGKLIVDWPPPERVWCRWADRNVLPVHAITQESLLDPPLPDWTLLDLSWAELQVLPTRLRHALAEWRGVYLIFDEASGKGYVGSAYGRDNILGRWSHYGRSGHGGNSMLKGRDPARFRFSILQRVSPDMDAADVIALETSWKARLHTYAPQGLNPA